MSLRRLRLYNTYSLRICYTFEQPKEKDKNMARPIKETPVLKGKDAVRFAERTANPAPVSKAEKDAARKAYETLKAISTFQM